MRLFSRKIYLPEPAYNNTPYLAIVGGVLFFTLNAPIAYLFGSCSIVYGLWVIAQRKSKQQTISQKARNQLSES